jgi:hypothetical protein
MKVVVMSNDKATFHYANHQIIRVWGSEHMQFWIMSDIALTSTFFVHSKTIISELFFFIQKTIIVISLLILLLPMNLQDVWSCRQWL